MNKLYFTLVIFSFFAFTAFSGGGCATVLNTTCSAATTITPGADCISGSTCGGGAGSGGSTCLYTGECTWFEFDATDTEMYVFLEVTATDGCHMSSAVYEGNCSSLSQLSCVSGTPLDDYHSLTGLTVGNTYYIEVCYGAGGPCGNEIQFCIEVDTPEPPCDVCANPCGTASGFESDPTVTEVTDDCETEYFAPALIGGEGPYTLCYELTPTAPSVDFNAIISYQCTDNNGVGGGGGGGNVTSFDWELYDASCGTIVETGSLSTDMTFDNITIGDDYIVCYTFGIPVNSGDPCEHYRHCPYFVGATTPLAVSFYQFTAELTENSEVELNWKTVSELNNDYFTVERSEDGLVFESIGKISGAGSTSQVQKYKFLDRDPLSGVSYYRIKQTDFDGTYEYTYIQSVNLNNNLGDISVIPNPVEGDNAIIRYSAPADGLASINITDAYGTVYYHKSSNVTRGENKINFETSKMSKGMYFIEILQGNKKSIAKFVK